MRTEVTMEDVGEVCLVCKKSLTEINGGIKMKLGRSYYMLKFFMHLKNEHGISKWEYIRDYMKIDIPKCKCGCGKDVSINITSKAKFGKTAGKGHSWNKGLTKNTCPSIARMAKAREGEGNWLYGSIPWNKGLTKETNETLKMISEKSIGKIVSDETRAKLKIAGLNREVQGHLGCKHSPETIDKIRRATAMQHANSNAMASDDELLMADILDELNIKYRTQELAEYFCCDFYLTDLDVYLECDGDYIHSNPAFIKDKKPTSLQLRNIKQDKVKNKYFKDNNQKLIRFWNSDIKENREWVMEELKRLQASN